MKNGLMNRINDLIVQIAIADVRQKLMGKDEIYDAFVASAASAIREHDLTDTDTGTLATAIINRIVGIE